MQAPLPGAAAKLARASLLAHGQGAPAHLRLASEARVIVDDPCAQCGDPSLAGLAGEWLCAWHFDEALSERREFAQELLRMLERQLGAGPGLPLAPEFEEIRHPALCGDEPA